VLSTPTVRLSKKFILKIPEPSCEWLQSGKWPS
jgi:hypothetical protein